MMRWLALAVLFWTGPTRACDIALVLGVDVSNSIDASEYDLQAHGMAQAFADPDIAEALIAAQAAIAVVQWSGPGEQEVSLDWLQVRNRFEMDALRLRISLLSRPFEKSDTAVGEALAAMVTLLDRAPRCERRVVDFAGDGVNNAGNPPAQVRARALERV